MVVNIDQLRRTANPYTHIQFQGQQMLRLVVNLRHLVSYGELISLIARGRFGPVENYFDAATGGVSVSKVEDCLDWLVVQLDRVRDLPVIDQQTTQAIDKLVELVTDDWEMSKNGEQNVPIRNRTKKALEVLNANEQELIASLFTLGSPLFSEGLPGSPVQQQQQVLPTNFGEINIAQEQQLNNPLMMNQPNLMQQRIDPLVLATLFGQKGGRKRKAQGKKPKRGTLRIPVKRRRNKANISSDDEDENESTTSSENDDSGSDSD